MSKTMSLKPRMSEKAYATSKALNTYVFDVPMTANKMTVSEAVSAQFNVAVEEVRIIVSKGKVKNSYRKGRRPVSGKRPDVKHAYVRVKQGDSINIFEAEEKAQEKAEKTADKIEKAQARVERKEQKRGSLRGAFNRGTRQVQNKGGDK